MWFIAFNHSSIMTTILNCRPWRSRMPRTFGCENQSWNSSAEYSWISNVSLKFQLYTCFFYSFSDNISWVPSFYIILTIYWFDKGPMVLLYIQYGFFHLVHGFLHLLFIFVKDS
jgi:hypothetical protein